MTNSFTIKFFLFFSLILLSFNSIVIYSLPNNFEGTAYLTFDDGPSDNTIKILDILKEQDVKATFFIIYPYLPSHKEIVNRIFLEGHALGNHTADHDFNKVYTSKEAFFNSFHKQQEFIRSITGEDCAIFRFPGGSRNTLVKNARGKNFTKDIILTLEEQGIKNFDWNVDSGDSHGNTVPAWIILKNVAKELVDTEGNLKNPAILLMHDCLTKKTTVEALPDIIKLLKERGYTFDVLK